MIHTDMEDKGTDVDDKTSLKHFIQRVQYWWAYLKHKWVLILLAFLGGAALGLTYSFLKKPLYDAGLSFAIQDDNSTGGKLGAAVGLASQFGIDLSGSNIGGAFSGDNLLELLRSRA